MSVVEERVFFSKSKALSENETLKMQGFDYYNAANLGSNREGFFFIFKADPQWFKQKEVIDALKDTEEIKGEEKEKIIKAVREIESTLSLGASLFD